MNGIATQLSFFLAVALVVNEVNAQRKVTFEFSNDQQTLVKVSPRTAEANGRADVFKINSEKQSYEFVQQVSFVDRIEPILVTVTNDRKYLIGIGNMNGKSKKHALTIFNLSRNTVKSFSLEEFESAIEFIHLPHYYCWFRASRVLVDDENNRVHIESYVRANQIEHYNVESGKDVVVDLVESTIQVKELPAIRRDLNLERARQEILLEDAFSDKRRSNAARAKASLLYSKLGSSSFVWRGAEKLFRLDPGNGMRTATIRVFEYSNDRKSFDLSTTVQLNNPIAPAEWRLSPDGRFILTFDEIDCSGESENAIGIYDLEERKNKVFSLRSIMKPSDIEAMKIFDNFIFWRYAESIPAIEIQESEYRKFGTSPNEFAETPKHLPRFSISLESMEIELVGEVRLDATERQRK